VHDNYEIVIEHLADAPTPRAMRLGLTPQQVTRDLA
jgi:hypothetical protein